MAEFYEGQPCKTCGGTTRNKTNRSCVVNHNTKKSFNENKGNKAAREEAKRAGKKKYSKDESCEACETNEYYVSTYSCVKCTKIQNEMNKKKTETNQLCPLEWHAKHGDHETNTINRYLK